MQSISTSLIPINREASPAAVSRLISGGRSGFTFENGFFEDENGFSLSKNGYGFGNRSYGIGNCSYGFGNCSYGIENVVMVLETVVMVWKKRVTGNLSIVTDGQIGVPFFFPETIFGKGNSINNEIEVPEMGNIKHI